MAITTLDGYIASAKQTITWTKSGTRTTVAGYWFSLFELAGNPGAGVLAGTSTTTGVVPTDATAGCPVINPFGGAATGYLSSVDFGNGVACRLGLHDLLWKGGAYAFNAATTAQTPTSYASRIPSGIYTGLQVWIEQVTTGTGVQSVNIAYNNQDGVAKTTGVTVAPAAGTVGRMWQMPLASGDTGIQGITGVTGSVASAGTFNVLITRPLWTGRCRIANDGDVHSIDKTGLPIVYTDSALMVLCNADSTSSGFPELQIEIANG